MSNSFENTSFESKMRRGLIQINENTISKMIGQSTAYTKVWVTVIFQSDNYLFMSPESTVNTLTDEDMFKDFMYE